MNFSVGKKLLIKQVNNRTDRANTAVCPDVNPSANTILADHIRSFTSFRGSCICCLKLCGNSKEGVTINYSSKMCLILVVNGSLSVYQNKELVQQLVTGNWWLSNAFAKDECIEIRAQRNSKLIVFSFSEYSIEDLSEAINLPFNTYRYASLPTFVSGKMSLEIVSEFSSFFAVSFISEYDVDIYPLWPVVSQLVESIRAPLSSGFRQEENGQRKHLSVAKQLLEESYHTEITMSEIAREVGISESSLYKLFKSKLEMTPMQYVLDCKLNHAKKLLREHSLSVNEVAYSVGYESVSSFSRAFYKKFKLRPGVFKTGHKIDN